VDYTLLDDSHFLAAGLDPDQLHGDYIAEDRARTVRVIPGLQELRYLIPFRPVEDCMRFLRDLATRHPGGLGAMGDDCEKFGAWPGTYDHCYRNGWLENFFTALESADEWLATTTPGEYVAGHQPLGRADMPTASYSEMMEWVLPTAARKRFHALHAEFAGRPDVERFLRGGHWRGFFGKYAEVNLLHKKMLHVSRLLGSLASQPLAANQRAFLGAARTHVLRAQCNDAYWHGIFGGLYAPHLRTEPWRELVRAETIADEIAAADPQAIRVERLDFNADGREELYVTSRRMAALVEPAEGGTISALDFRTRSVTVINSLQRRVEAYHSRLSEASQGNSGKIASIHDQLRVKEQGLERLLRYDRWPRHCFRVLAFAPGKTFADYQELRLDEDAALAGGSFAVGKTEPGGITLKSEPVSTGASNGILSCTKRFSFAHTPDGFSVHCAIEIKAGARAPNAQVGIEMVLNFLAPDEGDRYFEVAGAKHRLRWAATVTPAELQSAPLRIADEWQDVAATIDAPGAGHFWIAPIETVSESEEGFERVYQGSQILAVWPAGLTANFVWRGELKLNISPAKG
jgi:alpha-amylase